MNSLLEWDRELFLWFNGWHPMWLDPVMFMLTRTAFWIPLYVLLLYVVIIRYRKRSWAILSGVGLSILLADRITSGIMKPFFARPRPSHEPSLQGLVHIVNGYEGGLFGFASSHAANTMAIATFFWCLMSESRRKATVLFAWVGITCYSRVYLGVHYPADILAGLVVGAICGWVGFRLSQFLLATIQKSQDLAT